ncbi:hypothetical protein IFT66_10315 [Rhizobium sp. CFBP 13726]|uniref:hypothetical protein n=1 Tax=Rhizobium sp. CFBP 13726 TaxID=2775296 RepID=UPI00177F7469|nr:hypothetical protein [Rhizobium sp. CFBP 13726]MBD8651471.1 hypothetical protein [Rhizobium sp. CFBP 13726]
MKIAFTPQRREGSLKVVKDGDKLRINGALFSFISLPDGATIPYGNVPCEWIAGPVERIDGQIHLTLILPHGSNPSQAVAFPEPLTDPKDGDLLIPSDPVVEIDNVDT